jgi:hypothetical protein
MNLLSRSLYLLFPPRLPRLGPEDVAGTAEYYNRLARNHETTMNPPDAWAGRISTRLALRISPLKTAEKLPQIILRRLARVLRRDLLENKWRIVLQK